MCPMGKLPVPMPPPGEMLRRRQAKRQRSCSIQKLLGLLFLTAVVLILVFSRFLMLYMNRGLGMLPTANDGDFLLALRLVEEWEKDDMVVFRYGGELQLGRIVATEKDEVMMDDSGSLLVNGSVRNSKTLYPTYAREKGEYPLRIPEESVYILGDHRTQSRDSRDYGSIPVEDIMGKVIAVVRIKGL